MSKSDDKIDSKIDAQDPTIKLVGLPSTQPIRFYRNAQFLEQLEAEIVTHKREIATLTLETATLTLSLEALLQARDVLLGTSPVMSTVVVPTSLGNGRKNLLTRRKRPVTYADAVEQLLASKGPMRTPDLVLQLHTKFKMKTNAKNLTNTLNRWVVRGQRFKRAAPGTYALVSHTANGAARRQG